MHVLDLSSVQPQITALRTIFDESPDAVAIVSIDGLCLEQNQAHQALVGVLKGREDAWRYLPGIPASEARRLAEVALQRGLFRGEFHTVTRDQSAVALRVTLHPVTDQNGQAFCFALVARDISSRRRFEQRVHGLSAGPRGSVGPHVYSSLVRQVATAIEVRAAFIGKRIDDNSMHLLAGWVDGQSCEVGEVDIRDQPCQTVLDSGQPLLLDAPEGFRPHGGHGLSFTIRVYAGFPLITPSGQVVGVLSVVHDEPIPDQTLAVAVLRVFADRAAIEVERLQSDAAMQKLTQDLDAATAELRRLADVDALTNTLNRNAVRGALTHLVREARVGGTDLAAVMIDCDELGKINGRLGSAVGDIVLKEVGRRLREHVGEADLLGRIGGDEFLVLMPDTDIWLAARRAEVMRLAVSSSPIIVCEDLFEVTVSVGIVSVPTETSTVEELIALAHESLVTSKVNGRNRVSSGEWPTAGLSGKSTELPRVSAELLQRGSIRTLSHGIIRLCDEGIVGHEMLTRGPRGVFENPKDFFRLSLEQNMLTAVDLRCVQACIEAGLWLAKTQANVDQIHVNVFPSTLLATPVERLLEFFYESPELFVLELSEQQFLGDPQTLTPAVEALKRAGVRIAIDDVGFGRSSFETLLHLEPDIVKIDRSAVMGATQSAKKARVLARLVNAVRTLDATIVAEGIETVEELALVRSMGVEYGQGFLWGRPAELVDAA